jgi:cysteine desulfurase/selenocysteine lyase
METPQPLFDEADRRALFPVTKEWIYLNHAAVGPLPRPVRRAAQGYLRAISTRGDKHWEKTWELLEDLRERLAAWIGASSDEIAFTRNVSEGIGVLVLGLDWQPGDNVVLPAIEFPANVYPWLNLARLGVEVRFVPLRDGTFDLPDVQARVDRSTRVLAVSSVQFFNGFQADLAPLGRFCRDNGILFCVDAIQHLGALPLDVRSANADFLACGAHKWWMAGEGFGFLYCRRELQDRIRPAVVGWLGVRHWENFLDYKLEFPPSARRFETGNVSAFGAHALRAALAFFESVGPGNVAARVTARAGQVRQAALDRGWPVATPASGLPSGIVSFRVPGWEAPTLVAGLARLGVQVAARNGIVRVSPHFYNTSAEIDEFFRRLDGLAAAGPPA